MLNDISSIVRLRHLQLARGASAHETNFEQGASSTVSSSTQHTPDQAPLVCFDALAAGFVPTTGSLSTPPQANVWDPTAATFASAQLGYDLAQQIPDPDLDAIFAELLPTFGYDESFMMQSGVQPSLGLANHAGGECSTSTFDPHATRWESYCTGGSL